MVVIVGDYTGMVGDLDTVLSRIDSASAAANARLMPQERQTVSPARTGVWHWGQLKMGAVAGSIRKDEG